MAFTADVSLVARVNERTEQIRQGDVIEVGATTWLASASAPLTNESAQAEGSDFICIVAESDRLVVVSQTCDVVRDCVQRPFVLLARVVTLQEPVASEARRGHRPRFVPLPGLGADSFADLDLLITVEKSVFLDIEATRALPDTPAQRRFGIAAGRVFSRFAFPDDLQVALRGLVARIRAKHAKNSAEGRALAALQDIRITGSPSWDADAIDVFITFAPGSRAEANAVMSDDDWDELVDGWLRQAEPFGVIRAVDGAMIPLDELSALEYVESDALDLDHLSWAPAA
jgi:hypothetical protein